jgi:diguanylate cyclase (GGDEF)-like protein
MHGFPTITQAFTGADAKIQRQVSYWAATALLYCLGEAVLWSEVWLGETSARPAAWLTAYIAGGVLLFYGLIRSSRRLALLPSQLAVWQGRFAIICIVAWYAISGPLRGATLALLLVNLVFCAFTLEAKKSRRMSIFAIVLLGVTMIWMVNTDSARFQPRVETIHFLLAATMLVVVAYLTGELSRLRARLKAQKAELADALTCIQVLATRDELTLLANRRHMSEILANEELRHLAPGHPVCIALIDLDWFKQINDTHGHAAGDAVLRMFAQQAQVVLRTIDVLARWGGEEFLLFLPDTDLHTAKLVLERLKAHISALRFPDIAPDLQVTFSAGLIALLNGESINEGISRADHGMYKAKSQGRNCIVVP